MTIIAKDFDDEYHLFTNDFQLIKNLINYYQLVCLDVSYSPEEYGFKDDMAGKAICCNDEENYPEYTYIFQLLKEEKEATIEYFKIEGLDATIHNYRCRNNNQEQRESVQPIQPTDGGGPTV